MSDENVNEPKRLVVMLEDDHDRLQRFSAVLSRDFTFHYSRTADAFVEGYTKLSSVPCLIALDHDLFTDLPTDPDPGDGRDVVKYLVTQVPKSPVRIHSTNSIATTSMYFALQDSGWNVHRLAPLGDDWIESDWFPMALKIIGQGVR